MSSNMNNAYLINLDKTVVVGSFVSIEDAEAHGNKSRYEFTVVEDAGDIESQLKRDEMLTIYNALNGSDLKKFANKIDGAKRTFEALESHIFEAPKTEKPTAAKKPKSNGAVAQIWEIADGLHAHGNANRKNLLEAAEAAGINLNTAKTQWQHWRKANL